MLTRVLLLAVAALLLSATIVPPSARIVPGCTAYAQTYSEDPAVYWYGCPTNTCGEYPDECSLVIVGAKRSCACQSGLVTADCIALWFSARISQLPSGHARGETATTLASKARTLSGHPSSRSASANPGT